MKKHLIAAAVAAAVSVPAAAQVTVYGVFDTGYAVTNEDQKTSSANTKLKTTTSGANGQASGTRLGFRGSEDLGAGLKANFVFELGADTTEAAPNFSNRQGWVGLSGGFGELRFGRQDSFVKTINDRYTANAGASANIGYVGHGFSNAQARHLGYWASGDSRNNVIDASNIGRVSDAITLFTPKIAGFSANLSYADSTSQDSSKNNDSAQKGWVAGLDFANGPLSVSYARFEGKGKSPSVDETSQRGANGLELIVAGGSTKINAAATTGINAENEGDHIGASYNLGMVTLLAVHNKADDQFTPIGGTRVSQKRDDTAIGARVSMGSVTLLASISEGKIKKDANSWDLDGYQIGAVYNLSKRTNVYGYYGDEEVKATVGNAGKAIERDGFVVGVRHSF